VRKEDIKAIATEAGLDPDLWGYERAFEQFVELLELKYKKEHAGVCKRIAAKAIEESNASNSAYTRTVLRSQANTLKYASKIIEKKPPTKGG
jgi:hypothetical protein